ncbi:hypothetical protein BT96DRAFT_919666 [Gymnopus androsaceus JB14]|uniref:Uncharacterized protein n=1 Tax=Gymnopus androsaceus JB14 TaxID=1447944 RepID=A0A6A4HPV5_9AGAR|nr:hypothetical protein BT96DRAFT_919666 [Gymnopus androsaceus JB14]
MSNNGNDDSEDLSGSSSNNSLLPGWLYALLSYRGELGAWEWSFFVPDSSGREGTLFYVKIITTPSNSTYWKFEVDTGDIVASPEAVALVRLASVADLGHYEEIVSENGLSPMFAVVAIPAPDSLPMDFSSRSWFLDAIGMLHDCGVVQCDDVWLLEREIRRYAFNAMDKYLQNRGCTVYTAEKCS